ncbi:MAG: cytochrome b/b6 domain-containing protein [Hyphomicrobiales bacterium]|nr:cytochrome b/b6 domain-containing protein [Hyphomicrobiales bacterium]MBV8428965.1 cytochrome b/b6 domain-containing protein [Hyphomicrobiales bacterium]
MTSTHVKPAYVLVHPGIVRLTHWINAIAIIIMIGSGWRIYNNVPIFSAIQFPLWATLGGDPDLTYARNSDVGFSNALLWHLAGMWLFVVNGIVYLAYAILSGRLFGKFFPIRPREVAATIADTLRFRLAHDNLTIYNAVQKLLYVGVIAAMILAAISGLSLWKPVQLQALISLFQGFQGARLVHFLCMSAIALFLVVHVTLALLVPQTLFAMITGRVRAASRISLESAE